MPTDLSAPCEQLPDPLALTPGAGKVSASVTPPGSKSLTNRLVLLAALASGTSVLRNALVEADDARRMLDAVRALGAGVGIERDQPGGAVELRITGTGGRFDTAGPLTLDLGGSGTATRFLAAAAILARHPVTIDGNARMRERPIGDLADTLPQLGAQVDHLGADGYPPLRITPPASLPADTVVELDAGRSSQFASALLMLGPFLPHGLTLRLTSRPVSAPYLRMTTELLHAVGARVRVTDDLRVIRVSPGNDAPGLGPIDLDVEPDASGATYWWAAAALRPDTQLEIRGVTDASTQGDAAFPELLQRMGCRVQRGPGPATTSVSAPVGVPLEPVLADMSDMPDAAMTLAVVASFARGRSILRGLGTLRHKETDRIAALQRELGKLGVDVETPVMGDESAITISPPTRGIDCSPGCAPVHFDTYDDHRMAMSLALVSLRRPKVFINDPKCVAKTYPTFWAEFGRVFGG